MESDSTGNRGGAADAILQRLRGAIAQRAAADTDPTAASGASTAGASDRSPAPRVRRLMNWPRLPEPPSDLESKERYRLDDFLRFHDDDFVRNAYRALLRRDPDPAGYARFLDLLRTGQMAKSEILGRIRYSREGRALHIPVGGLAVPFALRLARRVPLLGRLLGIVQYLLRLPDIVRNHERLEAVVFQRQHEFTRQFNHAGGFVERAVAEVNDRTERVFEGNRAGLEQLRSEMFVQDRGEALEAAVGALEAAVGVLSGAVHALEATVGPIGSALSAIHVTKADRAVVEQQMAALQATAQSLGQQSDQLESRLLEQAEQLQSRLLSEISAVGDRADDVRQLASDLAQRMAERTALEQLMARIDTAEAEAARRQGELSELRRRLEDAKRGVLAQERRILLERSSNEARDVGARPSGEGETAVDAISLESFYVDFSDRFRGSPELIRERVSVYLPVIAAAGAGTAKTPVLDLGCGRGEWLDLLAQNGLSARGVDMNGVMVGHCRDQGLDVVEAEALAYLRAQPDGSLGAVSAMHVVEHLPFARLITLLDEILRALRPGGVVIFETPNPENLIVGACNFYADPTHVHPIPPATLQFAAEARGFAPVIVMRLHPYPPSELLADGPESIRQRLNGLLFGAQDYAIVGHKPGATPTRADAR